MPLKANYVGDPTFGNWEAIFVPSITEPAGSYDFRVTYMDTAGAVSDPLELLGALRVIAVPPCVESISPGRQERDVPITARVVVKFSQEMDKVSVESAFSLTDPAGKVVKGAFQWSDNSLTFTPSQNLEYNATYRVRIAGSASSAQGVGLDANGNGIAEGSPADDLSWWFRVEEFPVLAVKPASKDVIIGDIMTINVVAQSVSRLSSFKFNVIYNPAVLEVIKVEQESFVNWRPRPRIVQEADQWQPVTIDDKKGVITFAAKKTRAGGVSGTGTIAILSFYAVGVGESPIKLQDVVFVDESGKQVSPKLSDGKIKVAEFQPWDINQDGVVNILDFVKILTSRGGNPDINGDGVVNELDMAAAAGGAKSSPASTPEDSLGGNFPNPFNPVTWIPYQLSRDANVVIRIYSANGRLVRTLDLGYVNAGRYDTESTAARWDGTDENGQRVASGVYFYAIEAGSFSATKKMVLSK